MKIFHIIRNSKNISLFKEIILHTLHSGRCDEVFISSGFFVENNKKAAACIEENIRFTKFTNETKLINSDVMTALRSMEGKYQFDIVFMDPPYNAFHEKAVLEYLANSKLIHEDTLIIVEASLETTFDYLEDLGYILIKHKSYKSNAHAFIRKV